MNFIARQNTSAGSRYQLALEALMEVASRRDVDLDRSISEMLAIGCRYYGLSIGVLGHVVGEEFEFAHVHAPDWNIEAGEKRDLSRTYAALVVGAGEIVAIADVSKSDYADHGDRHVFGLNTFVGAPVDVSGMPKTVVGFGDVHARGHAFDAEERNFLSIAAHWIGLEMERYQNRLEIERSRNELQFIFDQLPARIWYKSDQNRVLRLNQAAARFIGMEPHEAEGRHVNDLFSDKTRQYHEDDVDVFEADEPHYGVLEDMATEVGERNWALVDKIPYQDDQTGERRLLIVANDVTETMRYRDALEELMDLKNRSDGDLDATLQAILSIGSDYYGLAAGAIGRLAEDSIEPECAFASEGEDLDRLFKSMDGTMRDVIRQGAPVAVHDVAAPNSKQHPDKPGSGRGCFVGAPLVVAGANYGVLGFFSASPRAADFSKDEMNFIRLVAHWVGVEIERTHAERDLRRSEQELRIIFDNVPSRIIFKDDANRILRLNTSAAESMNLSVEQAEGADSYELFPEMAAKYHRDDLEILDAGRPALGIVEEYTPKDGDRSWVQTDKIPYVDEMTGERRILAIISDITRLKRAEQEIRRANDELLRKQNDFRSLYRRTPAMMHSNNSDGQIVEVSEKWLEKLGYSREDVIGRKSTEFLSQESRQRVVEVVLPEFYDTGRCDTIPLDFVRKDGSRLPVELSAILDDDGLEGVRSLAVLDDVSERKRAQAALELRNRELELANSNLKQFAYVASHDLQEPLRKIQAFSDLVREAVDDGNAEELDYALNVLTDAAKRSRELVSDLLAFSRATNDEPELGSVRLSDVLAEVWQNLQVMVDETDAKLSDRTDGAVIEADRNLLYRLLLNLLTNAMKYRSPQSPPRIEVRVTSSGGVPLTISVRDNGIGFDQSFAERIFEPFMRLHSRADYPGNGIGLAICATVARRHGWSIAAESEPGSGATFVLNLNG